MLEFKNYLDTIGEIGFVQELKRSIIFASGLPGAKHNEIVVFESGDIGQIFSLNKDYVEILVFSNSGIRVGSQVARTNEMFTAPVGNEMLGKTINPMGRLWHNNSPISENLEVRGIHTSPSQILERKQVDKPLLTGVKLVDMIVPLSKGQRELVIGDRKTGKTDFLKSVMLAQSGSGAVCIYVIIGQKKTDILNLSSFFKSQQASKNVIIVATSSSDPAGLIYLTPFTAMTISEYFRDQGMDVLVILDDMTTHARVYREISLLAKRFPGRSAYPGDIFHLHAKLMERAGNFKKGSISALPVAESVFGDLSGYIQTNLMSMTDGHIFFDIDLYNEGKRPSINPFLSVTRIGHQTQTQLLKDLSRELTSFLVNYDRMKEFLHFGAEVGQTAKNILNLGSRVDVFLHQTGVKAMDLRVNIIILVGLWAGIWSETSILSLSRQFEQITLRYSTNPDYKLKIDNLVNNNTSFSELVAYMRRQPEIITLAIS